MAIWFFSANSRRVSARMHGELLDLPLPVRRRRQPGKLLRVIGASTISSFIRSFPDGRSLGLGGNFSRKGYQPEETIATILIIFPTCHCHYPPAAAYACIFLLEAAVGGAGAPLVFLIPANPCLKLICPDRPISSKK
jgi:hypothetical protein